MTKNQYVFGIIGIIIGLSSGYLLFGMDKSTHTTETASHSQSATSHADHPMLEVDASKPVPAVTMLATPDSKDGYNLEFKTQNFTLTPEKVGSATEPNTGHMHLYVNGEKVARLYGEWFHVSSNLLKTGENTIEVTLNANDHSEWTLRSEHIASQVKVTKK